MADGYHNDTKRTKCSFVVHPETNERLFRPGDLGRYCGCFFFFGCGKDYLECGGGLELAASS